MAKLFDFLLFQAAWFLCVVAGARGHHLAALAIGALNIALHLPLVERRDRFLAQVAAGVAFGVVMDGLLLAIVAIRFPQFPGWFGPPLFMWALWACLTATLSFSLAWLRGRPALAAVLGAAGGLLAYLAGSRLGAIEIVGQRGVWFVAVAWSIAMPALVTIHDSVENRLKEKLA